MKSAIVGCGNIASVHGTILKEHIDTELVGAADIIAERAEGFTEKFGGKPYRSLEELLDAEKPDVLHICTPHYLHVPMAVTALERGIHVFMEKPPVISAAQLEELKAAAAGSSAQLGFCYQNRYNLSVQAVKQLLLSGKAGKVLGARAFVTWKREAPYYLDSGWRGRLATEGGGVLINQSVHTMDLLCYLLGTPVAVDASMSNHHLKDVIEVEDTFEAFLTFGDGDVHASFYATTAYCADVPPLIELACEHMTIRMEDPVVTCFYPDGSSEKLAVKSLLPIGKSYWGTGHLACITDFYDALAAGTPFALGITGMENSIRLMLGAYESARTHVLVRL